MPARDDHDTPVEVNTLAAEHAGADVEEIDLLPDVEEFAESERLAIDGPPDDAAEVTPTVSVKDACGICLLMPKHWLLDHAPAPETCHGAWTLERCCGPKSGAWAWCPLKGHLLADGVVRDCNRRKERRGPPTGTPERRREPR